MSGVAAIPTVYAECFPLPEKKPIPFAAPFAADALLSGSRRDSASPHVCLLGAFPASGITWLRLLWPVSLSTMIPRCTPVAERVSFPWPTTFLCVDGPRLAYPFLRWWSFGLFHFSTGVNAAINLQHKCACGHVFPLLQAVPLGGWFVGPCG